MNAEEMRAILTLVKVPEFEFRIHEEQFLGISYTDEGPPSGPASKIYLQGHYVEPDVTSGVDEPQSTRKYPVSLHATKSELVQTAFLCYLQSMEHRARESFTYKGKRIYGPHINCDILAEMVGKDGNLDYRRTSIDTTSRHRTESGGNVFRDLGFADEDAERLLAAEQRIRRK